MSKLLNDSELTNIRKRDSPFVRLVRETYGEDSEKFRDLQKNNPELFANNIFTDLKKEKSLEVAVEHELDHHSNTDFPEVSTRIRKRDAPLVRQIRETYGEDSVEFKDLQKKQPGLFALGIFKKGVMGGKFSKNRKINFLWS